MLYVVSAITGSWPTLVINQRIANDRGPLHGTWQVRILQKSTVLEYLTEDELPNRFKDMTSHQTASDAVRLGVLSRYGGAPGLRVDLMKNLKCAKVLLCLTESSRLT